MAIRKRLKGGFTLIELMIVVAIVGVLAVLAVYGVRKYIANAKTAEAKNSLGQIGKDATSAFEGERMSGAVLPEGNSTAVLRALCQTGAAGSGVPSSGPPAAAKYQSTKVDWSPTADVSSNMGWPCLKYEMTQPQYYQYKYASDSTATTTGSIFSATANGDLNGDTVPSTFVMRGEVASGRLRLAPSLEETSPEE
jgi:type IV pilus assembly protein PilA